MTQKINPSTLQTEKPEAKAVSDIHEYLRPYQAAADGVLPAFLQACHIARAPFEGLPPSTGLNAALQAHHYALTGLAALLPVDGTSSWLDVMHARTWTQRKFQSLARDLNRLEVTSLAHALSRPDLLTTWAEQMAVADQATEAGELGVWGILNRGLECLPETTPNEAHQLLRTLFEALKTEITPNPPKFPVPKIVFPWSSEDMDNTIPLITAVNACGQGQVELITPARPYLVGPKDYEFPPFGSFSLEERFISVEFGEDAPMLLRIRQEDAQKLAQLLGHSGSDADGDGWIN